MILKKCTLCAETQAEPLVWVSSAWNRSDGVRVAYKHKLCMTCIATKLAPLHVASEQPTMTCPACGIDTTNDYDAVYIAWVPKGVGRLQTDCAFCDPCAARYRVWFEAGAERQEDRETSSRGTDGAPRYSAAETLAALGINVPHEA
jgi:hypothetical protein